MHLSDQSHPGASSELPFRWHSRDVRRARNLEPDTTFEQQSKTGKAEPAAQELPEDCLLELLAGGKSNGSAAAAANESDADDGDEKVADN